MGVSTDAILAYGIDLGEHEFHDIDEAMAIASDFDCELIEHCSDSYPMFFLAAQGTVTRAWRGHPKEFLPCFDAKSQWDRNIERALEALKIFDAVIPPRLMLFSWWG